MADKKTPLYDIHKKLGAKIIPFAGYFMPVMYDSINAEHLRVRNTVGMFDISHMGEFELTGSGARDYIQWLVTNDVDKLAVNQVLYSCMCRDNGGIIDDFLVYNLKDKFMLVVNASNIAKDFAHVKKHLPANVTLTDNSDSTTLIAVQGPEAIAILAELTDYPLPDLRYYHADYADIAGERVLLSRTGYTGEDGFEIYLQNDSAEKVWNAIYDIVKKHDGSPVGLGARDSLRLEMKFALYGNDIDETTNPIEAGLGWVVKLDKGDFCGKEAITKIKDTGIKRKLIGFEVPGKVFPRQGYSIIADNIEIGKVTSGLFSPSLKKGIGMGYVPLEYAKTGSVFKIEIRNNRIPATVTKTPFFKRKK